MATKNDKPEPEKKPMGRPRALTEEQKEQVIQWVKALNSREICAARLGIHTKSIVREMERDKEFRERLIGAEHGMRDDLVTNIIKQGNLKDWRASQFLLKSKFWAEFADQQTYTAEEVMHLMSQVGELIRKYVPEHQHLDFSQEVNRLVNDLEQKKKNPND